MKNICILQNNLAFGGTDTFVINLSKYLVGYGYSVTVVLSVDKYQALKREPELLATGATIVKTNALSGIGGILKHLYLLYKELKHGNYDAFQTNIDLFNGPQILVAWLAGVPVRECHSHNSQQGRELAEGRTLYVRIYQGLMRWLCWSFSNRRGGCSGLAMDFLFGNKWKSDTHSRIVHNGIDFSKFTRPLGIGGKRRELGLTNRYNICTVGRIEFQKNPMFMVEILNSLFQLRDDVDFVWVGIGNEEQEVRKKIVEYGIGNRIHFLGNRSDVSDIMRSCDLFLLPSRFEGLGIVVIEAQTAGLPCVVAESVPKEANCGSCLYLPLTSGADYWAQKISDVLDGKLNLRVDPEKLNEYSIEHMAQEMEALLS